MKVKLFGNLRTVAEGSVQEAAGTTVREALQDLCEDNESLREAIFDDEGLRPHVRVMVNGRDCELDNGLDTTVSAADTIAIFPPVAGG